MKSYKKTVIVLSILLLISLWYMYSNFEFYTESKANHNSSIDLNDSSMIKEGYDSGSSNLAKDTRIFNDIKVNRDSSKNIKAQQDQRQADYNSIFLANNNLPTDYKQLIVKKNIFGLSFKIDEPEVEKGIESQQEAVGLLKEEDSDIDKVQIAEEKPIQKQSENKDRDLNKPNVEINRHQVGEKKLSEEIIEPLANPFYLQAVSINEKDKMAIIVNRNNSKSYLIKPGQEIEDYIIKRIDYKKIVMEKDSQEIHVVFQN